MENQNFEGNLNYHMQNVEQLNVLYPPQGYECTGQQFAPQANIQQPTSQYGYPQNPHVHAGNPPSQPLQNSWINEQASQQGFGRGGGMINQGRVNESHSSTVGSTCNNQTLDREQLLYINNRDIHQQTTDGTPILSTEQQQPNMLENYQHVHTSTPTVHQQDNVHSSVKGEPPLPVRGASVGGNEHAPDSCYHGKQGMVNKDRDADQRYRDQPLIHHQPQQNKPQTEHRHEHHPVQSQVPPQGQQQSSRGEVTNNHETTSVPAEQNVPQAEQKESVPAIPTVLQALQSILDVSEQSKKEHSHCYSYEQYQEMQSKIYNMAIAMENEKALLHKKLHQAESMALKFQKECEELSGRLSAEMSDKVSTNETSIENVSIKNRPMKIAEEYMNFCSEVWLNAKTLLDEKLDAKESFKLRVLCYIIKVSENCAAEKQNEAKKKLYRFLQDPLAKYASNADELQEGDASKDHLSEKARSPQHADSISLHVQNAIGDHMRNNSDTVDLSPLEQMIHVSLEDVCNKTNLNFKEFQPLREYITKLANLTWKMVNQRPKMSFSFPGDGDPYKESVMEPCWGSSDPKNPMSVVRYCVTPQLYHGDKMMAKGKVQLVVKKQ